MTIIRAKVTLDSIKHPSNRASVVVFTGTAFMEEEYTTLVNSNESPDQAARRLETKIRNDYLHHEKWFIRHINYKLEETT